MLRTGTDQTGWVFPVAWYQHVKAEPPVPCFLSLMTGEQNDWTGSRLPFTNIFGAFCFTGWFQREIQLCGSPRARWDASFRAPLTNGCCDRSYIWFFMQSMICLPRQTFTSWHVGPFSLRIADQTYGRVKLTATLLHEACDHDRLCNRWTRAKPKQKCPKPAFILTTSRGWHL